MLGLDLGKDVGLWLIRVAIATGALLTIYAGIAVHHYNRGWVAHERQAQQVIVDVNKQREKLAADLAHERLTAEARIRTAVDAALALPLLPIIHFSVQRWRGVHPTVITGRGAGLDPDMLPAFFLGLLLFTGLVFLLIMTRARLERLREELRDLHVEAARLGLTEDDR